MVQSYKKIFFIYVIFLFIIFYFNDPLSRAKTKKIFKHSYIVQKGDTLTKIAKKLHTTVNRLIKINKIKDNLIIPGQEIFYLTDKDISSQSIGSSSNGSLKNGRKLPHDGRGYLTKKNKYIYGTEETIKYIVKCAAKYRGAFPSRPPLVIGDLSKKNGGSFPPHKSHQSGRDVDIGYLLKSHKKIDFFKEITAKEIDTKRTWFFIQCLLDTQEVKYIFMPYTLQAALYKYLLKKKVSKKRLSKRFEYPYQNAGKDVILRISDDHTNHFHVRFKCPKGDKQCVE